MMRAAMTVSALLLAGSSLPATANAGDCGYGYYDYGPAYAYERPYYPAYPRHYGKNFSLQLGHDGHHFGISFGRSYSHHGYRKHYYSRRAYSGRYGHFRSGCRDYGYRGRGYRHRR